MIDRREAILAQLVELAKDLPGIVTAARNKLAPTDAELPAIIIYDGDEQVDDRDDAPGETRRPANKPRRMVMSPAIEILLSGAPDDAGTSINAIRAALLKAILTPDDVLAALAQDSGFGIHYLGCSFGAGLGRSLEASMVMNFAFTYALRPQEL